MTARHYKEDYMIYIDQTPDDPKYIQASRLGFNVVIKEKEKGTWFDCYTRQVKSTYKKYIYTEKAKFFYNKQVKDEYDDSSV